METGRDHWQITYVMRLSLEDKNLKLTRTKPFEKKWMLGVIILIFFVGHSLYGFSFGVIRQFSLQTVLFVPFSGKSTSNTNCFFVISVPFSSVLVSLACLNFSYLPELTFSLGKPTLHERLLWNSLNYCENVSQ